MALLVHADGAVHAVIADQDQGPRAIEHGGGDLLAGHAEGAVAEEGHCLALRVGDTRRHRRRHGVAHGPAGRPEQQPAAAIVEEALGPGAEISAVHGDDGVRAQPFVEQPHHMAHVHVPSVGTGRRVFLEVPAGVRRPIAPPVPVHANRRGGGGELGHARMDSQGGPEDTPQFVLVRVNVNQLLLRIGGVDQSVALGGHLAQARPHHHEQVALLDPGDERRVGDDANLADEIGLGVVHQVVAAEGTAGGQAGRLGEGGDAGPGVVVPAAAADHHQRPFGFGQEGAQPFHVAGAGGGSADLPGGGGVGVADLTLHVLGHGDHHRARAVGQGRVEGVGHDAGGPAGILDLVHPFGQGREHLAEVHFLEGLAPEVGAVHLSDEQDHRGRILKSGMDPDAGVAGPRAPGHQADARPAGHLGVGLGHVGGAVLVTAGDDVYLVPDVVERVQDLQVAFAGDAENLVRAVGHKGIDDQLPAVARIR